MKLAGIAFTERGARLLERLLSRFQEEGEETERDRFPFLRGGGRRSFHTEGDAEGMDEETVSEGGRAYLCGSGGNCSPGLRALCPG